MSKKLTQSFTNLNIDEGDMKQRSGFTFNRHPELSNQNKLYKSAYGTENKKIINDANLFYRPLSNNSIKSDRSKSSKTISITSENLNSNKQEKRTTSLIIKPNDLPKFPTIENKNNITPKRVDISKQVNNIKEDINHDPVRFNY